MADPDEMVIRLYFDSMVCITTEEYEELIRELEIKQWTGTTTKGDKILALVLHAAGHRYREIKAHRAAAAERAACEARQVNGHGHCTHTAEDHARLGWTCGYWPIGRCARCNTPAETTTETTP